MSGIDRPPRPAPLRLQKPGLWRRTPPAIFPPIMGLLGLSLGWRAAEERFALPFAVADLILGAVTLLFLFALLAYLAKLARRPAVMLEDLRILPGRAGLNAASLSILLLAAGLVPFAPGFAGALALAGFGLHALLASLLVFTLLSGPPEGRVVTPVFHLSFVGFIIAGLAANELGQHDIAGWLATLMLIPATLIWSISLWQLWTRIPPAPLRPLLAIHVAPASLLATVAHGAGMEMLALALCLLAGAIFIALLLAAGWLIQAGFSPLWGAFTFPLAAFAGAVVTVFDTTAFGMAASMTLLIAASAFIPVICARILRAWADGSLAMKTNAAEA